MHEGLAENAGLTVAVALVGGVLVQALAQRVGVPGIVPLLLTGILLGPDGLNVVQPATLGRALPSLVNVAVAVILFEGGLNLKLTRIRRLARPIRRLLTLGALVTFAGATLTIRWCMGWTWSLSVVAGSLMIVTGPTVIHPLLRRIGVERRAATVLEAEGVFVDAVGAIVAVAAMEVVLKETQPTAGPFHLALRLSAGAALGALGGAVIAAIFRLRPLVPRELENVTALALALLLFQVSNAVLPESGLAAVIVAGMVVGNLESRLWRELHDFKGQLTVLLIGMLFVLLAADVRLAELGSLWPRALASGLVLILVVRPLAVLVSTVGSELAWRQRAFIAWIGPRGIVAAAMASVFSTELARHGMAGDRELRALVFSIIGLTVLAAGLSGAPLARWLRLRLERDRGFLLLGANALARTVAREIELAGSSALCLEHDPADCRKAEEIGLGVIYADGLDELALQRSELETRRGVIALSLRGELNLLFASRARAFDGEVELWLYLGDLDARAAHEMAEDLRARHFARGHDAARWARRIDGGEAAVEYFARRAGESGAASEVDGHGAGGLYLPLLVIGADGPALANGVLALGEGERLAVLTHTPRRGDARAHLLERGFAPFDEPAPRVGPSEQTGCTRRASSPRWDHLRGAAKPSSF